MKYMQLVSNNPHIMQIANRILCSAETAEAQSTSHVQTVVVVLYFPPPKAHSILGTSIHKRNTRRFFHPPQGPSELTHRSPCTGRCGRGPWWPSCILQTWCPNAWGGDFGWRSRSPIHSGVAWRRSVLEVPKQKRAAAAVRRNRDCRPWLVSRPKVYVP